MYTGVYLLAGKWRKSPTITVILLTVLQWIYMLMFKWPAVFRVYSPVLNI